MERIRHLADNTQAQLYKLTELDARPFTLNEHYFDDIKDKILAHLKGKRFPKPDSAQSEAAENDHLKAALASLAQLGYNTTAEGLAKLRPVDAYETELSVMAETRAYWHIAYKVSPLP